MERSALPVFLSVPYPAVNGITTYSINLARGLARLGYPTRILLTETGTKLAAYAEQTLELPPDVEVERLAVGRLDGWGAHWGALIRRLEESAPCVYVPNSDFRHSVVSPALSSGVIVVGVAHADEPLHYDHVARLGRYWNRIVCVSGEVAARLRERQPELAERIVAIRNGIEVPEGYPEGRRFGGRLELVYHGSFKQQQKRVLEFPALLRAVRGRGVEARLTLIGSGPDEGALREAGRELVAEGVLRIEGPMANEALRERLREFHVYVLNSEFEGMPQALLEAMSQGCVPVVTDVSSGTREVVEEGESGFLVGVGDFGAFAERIAALDADRGRLARLSRRAHAALGERGLRLADMAGRYDALFGELVAEQRAGGFVREAGPIGAPPVVVGGLSVFPRPLVAHDPRYGRFPSWGDVGDFEWELHCRGREIVERQRARPLFLAVRDLGSAYSTELALELAGLLRAGGYDPRILCLRPPLGSALRAPAGVPVETACAERDWIGASARLLRGVEAEAPCSFVAFDRETATLAPRLAASVRTLVLADRDDAACLLANALPGHLDGLVFSSPEAEEETLPGGPPASLCSWVIPYPVHALPPSPASARPDAEVALLAYLGHLDGLVPDPWQARPVLDALAAAGVACRFQLAVPREKLELARAALRELPARLQAEPLEIAGGPDLRPHLEAADLLLVPVALPGVSAVVLDAVGHRCIPVAVRSPGLAEALPEELAANLTPAGDPGALVQRVLAEVSAPALLRERAERMRGVVEADHPGPGGVAERWIRMFARVWYAAERVAARPARVVEAERARPLFLALRDLGSCYSGELAVELAEGLREAGHDVRLLCLRPPPPHALEPPPGVPVETACARREVGWAGAAARALRLVEACGPATYVAFDRDAACLAARLPDPARAIVRADNCDLDWLRASGLLRHVGALVLNDGHAIAELFPEAPPQGLDVALIMNPVHGLRRLSAPAGGPLEVLAYLGHLDGLAAETAGVCAVLETLAAGDLPLRLVVAVPPEAGAAARAALAGSAGRVEVEVAEVASSRALRPRLERSRLLLLPLLPSALTYVFGVVFDALGHGCLPVSFRAPALAGVLAGGLEELLVDEPEPGALARRILALARAPARLDALAERARRLIESDYPGPRQVADDWLRLLARVWTGAARAAAPRPRGLLFPPYPDLSTRQPSERLLLVPELGHFADPSECEEFTSHDALPLSRSLTRWARQRAGQ